MTIKVHFEGDIEVEVDESELDEGYDECDAAFNAIGLMSDSEVRENINYWEANGTEF